jgi:SWI/SNF-related matrix-associated actin-dependent regulator 1 of chromatin subfamily A
MDYTGSTCIDELNYILTRTLMIRRLKKDVLTELPPKTRQKIPIKLDEVMKKKISKKLEKTFSK